MSQPISNTSVEPLRIIILRHPVGETGIPKLYKAWLCVSADDFFLDKDGIFKFDPRKIQAAHNWAYNKAVDAIGLGVRKILVDNTNTKIWEFEKYVQLAHKHGGKAAVWRVVEVAPTSKVTRDAAELTSRFYTNYEPWKGELLCRIVNGQVQLGTPEKNVPVVSSKRLVEESEIKYQNSWKQPTETSCSDKDLDAITELRDGTLEIPFVAVNPGNPGREGLQGNQAKEGKHFY